MIRFRWGSTMVGALLALLPFALPLGAQDAGGPRAATVSVEQENFRAEPGGSILAELLNGTPLSLGEAQGSWRQATVEAWIWGRSVQEQRSGELDVVVNADGENLRATPNGERVGRALGGMRLDRLETRGDWVRVQRTGWIWAPSLAIAEGRPAETPTPAAPAAAPTERSGVEAATGARSFAAVAEGAVIVAHPGGDTVAGVRAGSSVEVLAREGDWSRVRVEGWTSTGSLAPPDSVAGGVLRGIARDSIQANPEAYRGRIVEWAVQFIALQEAERFRTDFVEGEPFMLTRGPGDDPGFVYVAVPPGRLAEIQKLAPLRHIRIVARVRTARSALTGAPVLDLLEITAR